MADAKIKEGFRGQVAEPPEEMRSTVLGRWKEYGFKS
jgi:hypothetical protein